MILKVTFELNGLSRITEVDELCKARDGFWIDGSGNYTQTHLADTFVMPHMIKEIRKEQEEKYEEVVDAEFNQEETS